MQKNIPYFRRQEHTRVIAPEEYFIGEDIHIIPKPHPIDFSDGYFKVNEIALIIFEKGETCESVNMQEYHIKAPAVLTILSGSIYSHIWHSEGTECRVLICSKRFIENLLPNVAQFHPVKEAILKMPLIEGDKAVEVYNHYLDMLVALAKDCTTIYKLEAAKHLTLAMYYAYTYSLYATPLKRVGRKDDIYTQFINLVNKHFRTHRDVHYYADRLCITVKYLSQVVKEHAKHSALKVIDQYVIAESKALLSSHTMGIQEIADALNFPSQSAFGKYFKRVTGVSPREYRNRG